MCDIRKIENLQSAIRALCDTESSFLDLDRDEQRLIEMAQALYTRADIVIRRKRGVSEAADVAGRRREDDQLGDLIHRIGLAQELGVLRDVLSHNNQRLLTDLLGGVAQATKDPLEEALRKRDQANFLRESSDTDVALIKRRELDELIGKKDR